MGIEITSIPQSITYTDNAKIAKASSESVRDVKAGESASAPAAESSVIYEQGAAETDKKATYSVNKMSSEDRASLVKQLKADQAARESQFTQLVTNMMNGQAKAFGKAGNIWEFLSSGEFTVDPATQAQAKEDISEDGYWGVKQTSQRLFDFASALAGDDVDKMKDMQKAMMKGFKMAGETWGRELPEISQQTIDAANKLFEDYYASKTEVTE